MQMIFVPSTPKAETLKVMFGRALQARLATRKLLSDENRSMDFRVEFAKMNRARGPEFLVFLFLLLLPFEILVRPVQRPL